MKGQKGWGWFVKASGWSLTEWKKCSTLGYLWYRNLWWGRSKLMKKMPCVLLAWNKIHSCLKWNCHPNKSIVHPALWYAEVTLLPPISIASHFQGSPFHRNTSEHLLLPFDKMKLHPWEFPTHCSLGYFTPVWFHYLLISPCCSAWL